ncbi:hypothetical protein [Vibrio sp. THAF190c]|jgi:hypothetical protein|uniref:hypothetical protein n=1 Tax=Vibrio sp. THAF190c TaxID=2587865 RepID=UPI001267C217|nr:hypothetical protein [Vibrio sp. THAF190c]QFT13443.1 hypothetical protein FIV04_26170 [Vibrio sp. THAF190c]
MNKVLFIPAYGVPIKKSTTKNVPTGEVRKGFLGFRQKVTEKVVEEEVVGMSDCQLDAVRLSNDLAKAVEEFNLDGYEVLSVTPITSGNYNYEVQEGNNFKSKAYKSGYAYGYGFSYTEGLTVVFKKVEKV